MFFDSSLFITEFLRTLLVHLNQGRKSQLQLGQELNKLNHWLAMFVSSSMIPARCVENINFHWYVKSLNPDVRPKNFI